MRQSIMINFSRTARPPLKCYQWSEGSTTGFLIKKRLIWDHQKGMVATFVPKGSLEKKEGW